MVWHTDLDKNITLGMLTTIVIFYVIAIYMDYKTIMRRYKCRDRKKKPLALGKLLAGTRDGIIMGALASALLGGPDAIIRGSFIWAIVTTVMVGIRTILLN